MNEQHNKPVTIQLIIVTFIVDKCQKNIFFLQINNIEGHNIRVYMWVEKNKQTNKPGK